MEIIKMQGLDEEIYHTTSLDGLSIYIWKNEYVNSFYLSLNTLYGSIHTEFSVNGKNHKVPNGIAHFMEHIKFNVKKGVTANDLFDPLGSDINAFTTFKYTSYTVMGTSKIEDNLNNLLDFVYNPYFTKEMISKEKGIIASEINMGHDDPYNELFFTMNKCIYKELNYKNGIAGEIDDIKKITLDDIKLVYNTFYHPKNMFLIVTGNVNPYEIEKIVNENLSKKEFKKYFKPTIIEKKEPKKVAKKEWNLKSNIEVEKGAIDLKIPRSNFRKIDACKLNIILNIILNCNFGDTSDLKEELMQNDLISFITYSRYVSDDYVVLDITFESKYLDEAIKRLKDALNNLRVDEDDLKRKINSSIATLILNYEDVERVNTVIQSYLIYYKDLLPNIKEIYESITLKDVEDVIKGIDTNEMAIVKMEKTAQ